MRSSELLQIALFLGTTLALAVPLGAWIARVLSRRELGSIERGIYRVGGVDPTHSMQVREYIAALLAFSVVGIVALFGLLVIQDRLHFAHGAAPAMRADLALNTAISFVSNTNWQSYSGEVAASRWTQMAGLAVQNFLSAAVGIAILAALARGITARGARIATGIGNFYVDLTRITLYVLLPASALLAIALVWQGVPQTLAEDPTVTFASPRLESDSASLASQTLPLGPVASQVAIKQLGTNGGGYYGTNSAHPFENPTPLSNFLEMVSILLIPAALCFAFGRLIRDRRQGHALLAAMLVLFLPCLALTHYAERQGNPALAKLGVDTTTSDDNPGGNMEGKEVRFGIVNSTCWATATTAASNGSVNAMHDAFSPLGSIGPFFLMHLGEVAFGGVGSGLYGLLAFAILAVFAAGLMVGRTPELFGKKIEAFEVQMAVIAILAPTSVILIATALAVCLPSATAAVGNAGPHAFSEILYCFTSQGANNGSAFAGLATDRPFYNLVGALAMLIGRFAPALCMLAIAGSLAAKRPTPPSVGTLPSHSPLFVGWLVAVVIVLGALSFLPALTLGPIVEHLLLLSSGA